MADHPHPLRQVVLCQKVHDGLQRHRGGLGQGIAVDPGGDGWEIHGADAVLRRQGQAGAVAGGQQGGLAMAAALPDGAGGVEHILGLQAIAPGQFGLPGLTAVQRPALRQQLRPGGGMDGAVHAAAAQQRGVGGVGDGLRVRLGDVAYNDGEAFHIDSLLFVPVYRVAREKQGEKACEYAGKGTNDR